MVLVNQRILTLGCWLAIAAAPATGVVDKIDARRHGQKHHVGIFMAVTVILQQLLSLHDRGLVLNVVIARERNLVLLFALLPDNFQLTAIEMHDGRDGHRVAVADGPFGKGAAF